MKGFAASFLCFATLFFASHNMQAALADEGAVSCIQKELNRLGYDAGPADGIAGRRTREAIEAFFAETKGTPEPLNETNAAQWCQTLKASKADPERKMLASAASLLLPDDVLKAIAKAPDATKERLCKPTFISEMALQHEPVRKISGLNSRQDNVTSVKGAFELEKFAGAFGGKAVYAFAIQDEMAQRELIKIFANWARADALLATRSCVTGSGGLITSGKCREWTRNDGSDLSGMRDATFATFIGAGLVRTYLVALADVARDELALEHAAIQSWIRKWSRRLKTPTQVYFGLNMGWYWPSIIANRALGREGRALQQLRALEQGLISQINADGSIKDRTTRGDRALWYHHTSIGEIVISMELMRAAGMTPSTKLESRLHAAVSLFLAALDDESVLDKWARQQRNSRYNGKQDWAWHRWYKTDFAGSWFHIYPYRYPDQPSAMALRKRVPEAAPSATTDIDLGLGLGCLYNIAAAGRE